MDKKMYDRLVVALPIGRDNAIKRHDLMNVWRCSDRTMRIWIADMRAVDYGDNYIIASSSHSGGYYRTCLPYEIERFINETHARARHTFRPLKKAHRVLDRVQHPKPFVRITKGARDAHD